MLDTQFTMTPAGAAIVQQPVDRDPQVKPKFDAEFIERRMREHRALQEQMAAELENDIVSEVLLAHGARQ